MIHINWAAATSVVALGALLTALLTYIVAIAGRSNGRRPATGARCDGARTREFSGTAAAERRHAA